MSDIVQLNNAQAERIEQLEASLKSANETMGAMALELAAISSRSRAVWSMCDEEGARIDRALE